MVNISYILALFLVGRHCYFYLYEGGFYEFGTQQPLISFLLMPTTALLGSSFFFMRQQPFEIRKWALIKLLIIILMATFYNSFIGNVNNFLNMSIDSPGRRPVFLILLPIFMGFLYVKTSLLPKVFIIGITIAVYLSTKLFILHYFLIFTVIYHLGSCKFHFNWIASIAILTCYLSSWFFFKFERIDFFFEVIVVYAYCFAIHEIGKFMTNNLKLNFLLKFSLLDFYVLQALVFTLLSKASFNAFSSGFFYAFSISVTLAILMRRVESSWMK